MLIRHCRQCGESLSLEDFSLKRTSRGVLRLSDTCDHCETPDDSNVTGIELIWPPPESAGRTISCPVCGTRRPGATAGRHYVDGSERRSAICADCRIRWDRASKRALAKRRRRVASAYARRCHDCGRSARRGERHLDHQPAKGQRRVNLEESLTWLPTDALNDILGRCETVCTDCFERRAVFRGYDYRKPLVREPRSRPPVRSERSVFLEKLGRLLIPFRRHPWMKRVFG